MDDAIDADAGSRRSGAVPIVQVREGRSTTVGGMGIRRVLPTKRRRAVGPWCFVDLMTPEDVAKPAPLEIGPHPHIGLATVTWLFEGSAVHGDSLGTEQLIRPGELNLMTAGHGIAHAELGLGEDGPGARVGDVVGAQIWVAQPEASRHGESAFQHVEGLPRRDLGSGEAIVLMGTLGNAVSPARFDHPLVGLDVTMAPAVEIPADPSFEFTVVPLDRPVKVGDVIVEPGSLALIPAGLDTVRIEVAYGRGRALVLGGEPLGEDLVMWWNFVARDKREIAVAYRDWRDHNEDRFGKVPSDLARVEAPRPPWLGSS